MREKEPAAKNLRTKTPKGTETTSPLGDRWWFAIVRVFSFVAGILIFVEAYALWPQVFWVD